MTNIYDFTAERLQAYYPFDQEVTDAVAYVAAIQSRHSYGEFLDHFRIPEPQVVRVGEDKRIKVLDIMPEGMDIDDTQARVVHLAMGNDLSKNQIYQIATTHAADPAMRTIAFANPSGPRHKAGILPVKQCVRVARGDTRLLVDRQSRYVAGQRITTTIQEGFSYGCLPALASTQYAELYDQQVSRTTAIEPADNKARSGHKIPAMLSLAGDFGATAEALAGYVKASGIDAFSTEARGDDGPLGMVKYVLGLGRLTNLAISSALADDRFYERARDALSAQESARLSVVWGSESELVDTLVDTDAMTAQIEALQTRFEGRVSQIEIPGGRHNMVNDIHLQAALMLQARRF
jgi:hypothetical protein